MPLTRIFIKLKDKPFFIFCPKTSLYNSVNFSITDGIMYLDNFLCIIMTTKSLNWLIFNFSENTYRIVFPLRHHPAQYNYYIPALELFFNCFYYFYFHGIFSYRKNLSPHTKIFFLLRNNGDRCIFKQFSCVFHKIITV